MSMYPVIFCLEVFIVDTMLSTEIAHMLVVKIDLCVMLWVLTFSVVSSYKKRILLITLFLALINQAVKLPEQFTLIQN